jgi:hypothetical protein
MKRWNIDKELFNENKNIDEFIDEINEVCKKHDLSISHEDCEGSFVIKKYSDLNIAWLREANDDTDKQR